MKSLLQSLLLFVALVFALSSCNSQEDSLTKFSLDSIAFSQEFEEYFTADNMLLNFITTHDVDMAAMEKVATDYAREYGDVEVPSNVFQHIEGASELHQLMLNRAAATKVVDRKFGFLSMSESDRKKTK